MAGLAKFVKSVRRKADGLEVQRPTAHSNSMDAKLEFDLAVVGGGPAGLTAACLAGASGLKTAFWPGPERREDLRTTALMLPAIRLFQHLGVWTRDLSDLCAPLQSLQIRDATGRVPKAPTVTFEASEISESEFGWNVPVMPMVDALSSRLSAYESVTMCEGSIAELNCSSDRAVLQTDAGAYVTASAVIAADGQRSVCRAGAKIRTSKWDYPQTAIVTSFAHSLPHSNMSIEFHRPAGPFTTVPLPGNRSSLVWIETDECADGLFAESLEQFSARLEIELEGQLGKITDVSKRGKFPIRGSVARAFAQNRVFLVGEAAHVIPPIGAQGLNLSLRDAASAVELLSEGKSDEADIGGRSVQAAYDTRRRRDVFPRQMSINILNRTLVSSFLPFQSARSLGLAALQIVGPLRRSVMRQGLAPTDNLPRTMAL